MTAVARVVQELNTYCPMLVTLLGIVTLFRCLQEFSGGRL